MRVDALLSKQLLIIAVESACPTEDERVSPSRLPKLTAPASSKSYPQVGIANPEHQKLPKPKSAILA